MNDIGRDLQNAFEDGYKQALKWIPVSERLPNEQDMVKCDNKFLITDDFHNVITASMRSNTQWEDSYGYHTNVIAWLPLPKPY